MPRRAIEPEAAKAPAPQAPKQLDLFSGPPIRQSEPVERYQAPAPSLPRTMRSTLSTSPFPPPPGGSYAPEGIRQRVGALSDEDDYDTPPSLRYNDLRDIFPEN